MSDGTHVRDVFVVVLSSALLRWEQREREVATIGQLADWIIDALDREGITITQFGGKRQ